MTLGDVVFGIMVLLAIWLIPDWTTKAVKEAAKEPEPKD